MINKIAKLLGDEVDYLLNHTCQTVSRIFCQPSPDFVDRVLVVSDRPAAVLRNMQLLFSQDVSQHGFPFYLTRRLGVEHSAGASFAPNPIYFDPDNIVKLAIEGGCNAVASTLGVLGSVARKYAHKIFILKINHNELLTTPISLIKFFCQCRPGFEMGQCCRSHNHYGSEESSRQIQEISRLSLCTLSGFGHDPVDIFTQ